MRLRRFAPLAIAACFAPGCSLLVSLDGLTERSAADASAKDGSPTGDEPSATSEGGRDAARDADETDTSARDDAGPNLYPEGTFESACPTEAYNATITVDGTAHGGARSCRVCSKAGTDDIFTIDETPNFKPTVGARYRADAWVRSAPNAPVPTQGVSLTLRIYTFPPFVSLQTKESGTAQLDASWRKLSVVLDVTKQGQLDFFVGGTIQAGACFLIDDVEVRAVP